MAARNGVTLGGIAYPSLREASRQTGTPLSTLRRSLGLIGPEQPQNRPQYRETRRRQEQARRAITSGKASALRGAASEKIDPRDRRLLRWEMPTQGKPPRRISLTRTSLIQIDARILVGDIAQASLTFYHYYLSPTERDKNGNPSLHIRRDIVTVTLDELRAVPLSVREATGMYPFSDPEHQLHEDAPRLPSGRRHPKHRDDGGLLAVTLTPRRHTSL